MFRDGTYLTGICFYVPSMALLALLPAAAWSARATGNRPLAKLLLSLTLLPALTVWLLENRPSPAPPMTVVGAPWKLVHWNVCRGKLGWESIQQTLAEQAADIYVLSEVPWTGRVATLVERLPPGYDTLRFNEMTVVARGELLDVVQQPWPREGIMHRILWRYQGREVSLLLVDLPSSLWKAREPMLQELIARIESEQPDLVVGDLNAPRRSWRLSQLPAGYRHAYLAAGTGLGYTWPVPAPMYSIDHCILRDSIRPIRYALQSSWRSDHRLQRLEFLPPASVPPALESTPGELSQADANRR